MSAQVHLRGGVGWGNEWGEALNHLEVVPPFAPAPAAAVLIVAAAVLIVDVLFAA